MKNGHIIQAWLVILLATAFGAGLAAVQDWLGPRIEQNKRGEMLAEAPRLVPGCDASMCRQMTVAGKTVWKACDSGGGLKGWVIRASGQGFVDTIELLVGLDASAETITGVYVVDQKETPGSGGKISSDWIDLYRNQKADTPLTVTQTAPAGPGQIMAITGATRSSEYVTKIVNEAVASVREQLRALGKEGAMNGPSAGSRFWNGIGMENPTFRQVLGICPTLAVTSNLRGAMTMAATVMFVLVTSNLLVSGIRGLLRPHLRIVVFTLVIAAFVTVADRLLAAFMPAMSKELGPYVPLIIVNCIIIARCEIVAARQGLWPSFADAVGQSAGFGLGLASIATVREILGSGTLAGLAVMPESWPEWGIMVQAPGAFIALGLLMGLVNWIGRRARSMGVPPMSLTGVSPVVAPSSSSSSSSEKQEPGKEEEETAQGRDAPDTHGQDARATNGNA